MKNPLVKMIQHELNQFSMNNVELIHESFDAKRFGDAEAIYKFGSLLLRFIQNRSDQTVEIDGINISKSFYNIEDVAILLGWVSLSEILAYDMPINFNDPLPGPFFSVKKALMFIKKDSVKLEKIFSSEEYIATVKNLKNIQMQKNHGPTIY